MEDPFKSKEKIGKGFSVMKKVLKISIPWLITVISLYCAFYKVNFGDVVKDIGMANKTWLLFAASLTVLSYFIRSWRWRYLLPENTIPFFDLYKVLILGFFINNIVPARAGEIARAHLGTKISPFRGTLILASVAAERLVDGLTISLFLGVILGLSSENVNPNLKLVAYFFLLVAVSVILTLIFREKIQKILSWIEQSNKVILQKLAHKLASFLEGLSVLSKFKNLIIITLSSILIWSLELVVFYCSCSAFNLNLDFFHYVVLLVVVNFSSLIPAAPGAFGTVEYFGQAYLMSVGVNPETSIAVILTQHFMQYVIVGIPGIYFMYKWGKNLLKSKENE